MNVNVEDNDDVNLCQRCKGPDQMYVINVERWDIFQRDCKYDGDRPAEEGQASFDSYNPVIGKWMTNLVATIPITVKAMKSLYAEQN